MITGPSGCGKSTLAKLLQGFYPPEDGRIEIDGRDIRHLSTNELRQYYGVVPQETMLFANTVYDNLSMASPHAGFDEVITACRMAGIHEVIEKMPQGYQTWLGEHGVGLSGGQKQRLAIARALVRDAEIYVFDDSFSALDFATDARLRAALKADLGDATVFIVSQRIGTVMTADRIVVLDDGRVAGIGTHAELVKSCEVYRQIAESQASLEEVA